MRVFDFQMRGGGKRRLVSTLQDALSAYFPDEIATMPFIKLNGGLLRDAIEEMRSVELGVVQCLYEEFGYQLLGCGRPLLERTHEEQVKWIQQTVQSYCSTFGSKHTKFLIYIDDLAEVESFLPKSSIPEVSEEFLEYYDQRFRHYEKIFDLIFSFNCFHVIATGESQFLFLRDSTYGNLTHRKKAFIYQCRSLYLRPFTDAEIAVALNKTEGVAEMLSERCGAKVTDVLAEELHVITLGIPGLVENVIRLMLKYKYAPNVHEGENIRVV